ncbi:hypothetical protein N836_24130 [Leptolyngbya sp. Heron Island J]|uniref:hypothetical protein n=1 Tax=Leptolyngbya sp. Heron Island J TaxID=1385935 RepID=UPI0003B97A43|nr:hypothetical protein [Leptolyngbya sp. Heron Island J]ESA32879.1 hypothetical protein N836_24130 [Leptolyngbya sp. Heron Island J]
MANGSFEYKEKFDEIDPHCKSNFKRTLKHQDWIDGKSVVQAESNAFDEGFNVRFHDIENDLEALGSDNSQAFACIADIRKKLYAILNEIREEFNDRSFIFTFYPKASRRGGEVTIYPDNPRLNIAILMNGRFLPKKSLDKGRKIVFTVPGDAKGPAKIQLQIEPPNGPYLNSQERLIILD